MPDRFEPRHPFERVTTRPGAGTWGRRLQYFATIGSTNDEALEAAARGAEQGTVIVADGQVAGRGRHGRTWHASAGENLLATWILRPSAPVETWSRIPLAAAVAVAVTAAGYVSGRSVRAKWPNDVRIAGRKVAGILAESRLEAGGGGFVVLGIGLNVNQQIFEPELADIATSLALESGKPLDRSDVLGALCDALEMHLGGIDEAFPTLLSKYRALLEGVGSPAVVRLPSSGDRFEGRFEGVDDSGALVLVSDGTRRTFSSGEVTLRSE